MGKTSIEVKERWNKKTYADLRIRIPKGRKEDLELYCKKNNDSINGLVNRLIWTELGIPKNEWGSRDSNAKLH